MALQTLFGSTPGPLVSRPEALNAALAPAYAMSPKQALAQYAATGCFSRTFYASGEEQLTRVLELCQQVEPEFIARLAVYARKRAFMKDMPALLLAHLAVRSSALHESVFPRVIDSLKMLRTYVQIVRSGVTGRKSLGTAPKRLVRQWLAERGEAELFRSSAGQNPSLGDILKMVHPKPGSPAREAFYGYLLGRPYKAEALPALVAQYERFRLGESGEVPDLPFTLLSSLPLQPSHWLEIARNASWQTTRMNLNTFARHGVFSDPAVTGLVAERLRNPAEVARARVFPYQLLAAFQNTDSSVPAEVRNALQDAMELAVANVPQVTGHVVVCPDVSGSMASPVTGYRGGATSSVRCIDIAGLVAASVIRRNDCALVLPFAEAVRALHLNARDSVMSNAEKLAALGGGGTNCSAPMAWLNERRILADLVIFVSDNQSWVDAGMAGPFRTALMDQWAKFRTRNPRARLVCLDVQPYVTSQAVERADILNIGGFSDAVFEVIAAFASGELEADHWLARIESAA